MMYNFSAQECILCFRYKAAKIPVPKRLLHLLILFQLYSVGAFAQTTIRGIVTDSEERPLQGVSVALNGTSIGTTTDAAGKYSLNLANAKGHLIFSFIGFTSMKIDIAGKSGEINIVLVSDNARLDEVLVVGYGIQKKENLTGAVSSVSSKDIQNRPVSNLANALQGTMPGFLVTRTGGKPGSENIEIQVRGATSANGGVPPLLVVDGITTPIFTLQTINPNDIASISVLKDASAAAIYGAQAAGGVILVTTKSGKSGKTKFEYSNLFGADWALNIPKRLTLLQEAEYSNLARANAGVAPEYSEFDLENIRNNVDHIIHPTLPIYYIYYNQKDHVKETLRKYSFMNTHNLSASGGTDKLSYSASLGLYDKKGVFKVGPDGLKRYNARLNLGAQLTKHISLDSRLSYSLQKQQGASTDADGQNLFFQTYHFRQQYPIFTPEGRLNGYGTGNYTYARLLAGGYDNTDRNYFDGIFTLKAANFVKGLQLRAVYGAQYRTENRNRFRRTVELWGRSTVIDYLNNPNSFLLSKGTVINNNLQFLADYDFNIGNKNKFHILAGYQWEDSRNSLLSSTASSLVSNDLPSLNLANVANKNSTEAISTYAYQSYFGRFNYSYDDRFLFEATVRADESSRLAPGKRIKSFPAASAGWNMHRENWFSNAFPFISTFKPRISWGRLGSVIGVGDYAYLDLLSTNSNIVLGSPETRVTYFYQDITPSSSLTWETVETTNGGVDFGLFQNKLQISSDYYVKYNRNMFTPLLLPSTFGVGTPRINNGKLKSWGWEVDLKYFDKIGKNIEYSLGFNLSDTKNKLISYAGRRIILPGYNQIIEGYPLNSFWGYKTDGYFSTTEEAKDWAFQNNLTDAGDIKYLDLDGDKKINGGKGTSEDHGDLVYMGSDQPRYAFGFTGSMTWKNIDFSFFFQGIGKRSISPSSNAIIPLVEAWIQPLAIHQDYWTKENPNAVFPRPYLQGRHNFLPADKWLLNGQYLRLKNIQMGYAFSETLLRKINISHARIYFSGQDILTFSKMGVFKSIFNPETRGNGAGSDYPFFATISMGLNITL
ncbi:TonB-dependent receptor [Agriterribacter sp.]|uniref:SusC/RagA family TonB-linked outer membrane protein n=1 Tax=Agriterribacter sp. TaxID=2821509 RepID=UPI002CE26B12|nr:TonB-dependent receptor [Agriterribacter sp.]HTN06171.1 TonB-dependent receptor [Agriterribacter sp.]